MRLSLHLQDAEGRREYSRTHGMYPPSHIISMIKRVKHEEDESYEWPGFTNDDLGLIKLKGKAKSYEIALRYNSAIAVLIKTDVEEARQKQEIAEQERQKRKTNFVSAVRSKPTNDVAQGPNGDAGFQTHPRPASTELKVF